VRREATFRKVCPPLFLKTDPSRLPASQLAQVMAWTYGPRGLILRGDTGTGKTRTIWTLLHRVLVLDMPEREFSWVDGISFGHDIVRHFKVEDAEDWLDGLARVPILFFDDFGKLKMTERAETELFGIVDRRCMNELPIIVTTNDTGETLEQRMTEGRGPALIRRLREFCELVQF